MDRGQGWVIQKLGKIDAESRAAAGAEYHLIFEGHEPLVFAYLGAARERAKEAPPEQVAPESAQAAAVAEEGACEPAAADAPAEAL